MNITIKTNNRIRELFCYSQLSKKEQKQVKDDYGDYGDLDNIIFFKYKGFIYDLSEFLRIENHPDYDFSQWQYYSSDSAFSGIVIKYPKDTYGIIVGTYRVRL